VKPKKTVSVSQLVGICKEGEAVRILAQHLAGPRL